MELDALHLGQVNGAYVLDVLGKTGEIKPRRPVRLKIRHRDFRDPVDVSLQTDTSGRIHLGTLEGIDHLEAAAQGGRQRGGGGVRGQLG